MNFLIKENFKAKKADFKRGHLFNGKGFDKDGKMIAEFSDKEAKELEAQGLIIEQSKVDAATLSELEKKIAAAKAELSALEAKSAKLKPQGQAPQAAGKHDAKA